MFKKMFSSGKRVHHRFFTLILSDSVDAAGKWAFLCYKRTGCAVMRKKIKRRMKSALFGLEGACNPSWNMLVVGKKPCLEADFGDVKAQTYQLLKQNGVLT